VVQPEFLSPPKVPRMATEKAAEHFVVRLRE